MAVGIWREGLHQLLWERRYGDDLVEINQKELAEQLSITRANLNRAIQRMVDQEWIAPQGDQVYRVYDPDQVLVDAD